LTLSGITLYLNRIEDLIGPVLGRGDEGSRRTKQIMEDDMATAREIKEKAYFDEVYKTLEDLKMRLYLLREDLAQTYGKESRIFMNHDRHLLEMADYIEWKLQVLEKGTAFDWKTAKGPIESEVSVRQTEVTTGPDFSGGYVGG
jgi:hypothetical protein